jgi:two-component system CheB/CheR fusion protein
MISAKTSQQLIEQLEILPWQKNNQEVSKNLIQLLKLALDKEQTNSDALAQNMNEGVAHCRIICDSNGVPNDYRFLSVNKAFESQSGIPNNQTDDKTILEIFPDIEKFWIKFYGDVALTQQPNSTTQYNHNTKRHYISSAYSSTKGEFTMLFKDVTESLELTAAHLEIAKSQERNSAVLKYMEVAFSHCEIICDDKGEPINYTFLNANRSFEKQIGVRLEDMVGKTILDIFPDIEQSWIKILGQVALTNNPTSFEKFNHNTNSYYQVNAFSPAKEEFVVFLRDITDEETKRIELEKAHLKAEENDKLKSAFLANMSHEVRTPMNAILGFSSLLEDDAVSEEDKRICLKQIKTSGNNLLTIISDIVDISKIEAKQQKLVLKECDLNQLFDELHTRYSVLNTNTELLIKIDKGQQDAFIILTDETRLNQILSNLIDNALKYTQKGEVVIGYSLKSNELEFYVKDTGIGIKKENQKMVFERFAQVNDPSSTVSTGTGLGIPIAKGLVELFKGEIWLISEPQKGSTFYFSIPINMQERTELGTAFKYTILIAEDDDVNFLLLNLWLNSHFNIIRAINGIEAVQLYEKNDSIDLILMDIRMPHMDGIEATKEIRKMDMYIPIIAHTAYAMNEESFAIKKAGCNQVLIKPITRNQLLDVLGQYKIII